MLFVTCHRDSFSGLARSCLHLYLHRRVVPSHQMAFILFKKLKKTKKTKKIFVFVSFQSVTLIRTHTHTRSVQFRWEGKLGRSFLDRQTAKRKKDGTGRGWEPAGEARRSKAGENLGVLNGAPKPLRGSVGKVTWPELGPFYITSSHTHISPSVGRSVGRLFFSLVGDLTKSPTPKPVMRH